MLDPHHLLQLVPQRSHRTLERLEKLIWHDRHDLVTHWTGKTHAEHITLEAAQKLPLKPVTKEFFWGKLFEQTWFRTDIPQAYRNGEWFLDWREHGESTAYIDGLPYAGFDVGHFTARLPKGTKEVWVESMCLETGIWLNGTITYKRPGVTELGCRFDKATLVRRNEDAWHAYHDLSVLHNMLLVEHAQAFPHDPSPRMGPAPMDPLRAIQPRYRKLLRRVDDAISLWEARGLPAFRKALAAIYSEFSAETMPLSVTLTGHAHIDLVWLWPERCSEAKAVHSFANANYLMDEYPEFRFGYSQPASYRAVGRRSPQMLRQVKKRIGEGKWEAVGAMEVESDTQIACGEALVRSLTLGQEGFTELTGSPAKVVWLPDVFGYSACLPQMMAQTGVKYFFTTKLTWGAITHFPYSTFLWRGNDGSEIACHVSQGFGYNQNVMPQEIHNGALQHRQSDIHPELLMPCGYGDGGGGPTAAMCERARRVASLSGLPTVQWGGINDFFSRIDAVRTQLPTYYGELYLQYHRGVLTTHGNIKDAMRAAERALQVWEAAQCAGHRGPIDKEAWRRVVFAQFHDYIPGSSIREVYEEAEPELRTIANNALAQAVASLGATPKDSKRNASAAKSSATAAARKTADTTGATAPHPSYAEPSYADAVFNPLPLERTLSLGDRLYRLGPLQGGKIDSLEPIDFIPVTASTIKLRNDRLTARFDKKGRITSLSVDGHPVALDGRLGDLALYPDLPHQFDPWDIDRQTLSNGSLVQTPATVRLEASEPTYAVLAFTRQLTPKSSVTIRYILEAGQSVLRAEYAIDWHEERTLLRVLFPTHYRGKDARFGTPYGSALRSQQPGQPYDEAQWEVAGSRWTAISDDGERDGLCVITEAKYGWSAKNGSLQLSLLRSASVTMDSQNPTLRAPSLQPFSDTGSTTVRIALGRFSAQAPLAEQPAALCDSLFTDAIGYNGPACNAGFNGISGANSLIPAWAKPVGNGEWILRLHEVHGQRGTATLALAEGWSASLTDLLETQGAPLPDNRLSFTPYQIVSIRISKTH